MRCARVLRLPLVGLSASALTSCSASATVGQHAPSAYVITGEQIRHSGGANALDGVRLLRPMIRPSSSIDSPGTLVAYLDGVRLTQLETLRTVDPDVIQSLRYLEPSEAGFRFGSGHPLGAIVVITHQGR